MRRYTVWPSQDESDEQSEEEYDEDDNNDEQRDEIQKGNSLTTANPNEIKKLQHDISNDNNNNINENNQNIMP